MTDGSWTLIDGISEILRQTGVADLVIATWTAAKADTRKAESLLQNGRIRSIRFLVDRSFQSRQPEYCALVRKTFGDDAVRVWNCHAKFCIFRSEKIRLLYLTSANLNRGLRVENFSIFRDAEIVDQYESLVENLFAEQKPGESFAVPSLARKQTRKIFRSSQQVDLDSEMSLFL